MARQMKTYKDNNRIYFYDFIIKSWTVYECDKNGNQTDKGADHYGRREHMVSDNPEFKFTIYND